MRIALPGLQGAFDPRMRDKTHASAQSFVASGFALRGSATFVSGLFNRSTELFKIPVVPLLVRDFTVYLDSDWTTDLAGDVYIAVEMERSAGSGLYVEVSRVALPQGLFSAGVYDADTLRRLFGARNTLPAIAANGTDAIPHKSNGGKILVSVDSGSDVFSVQGLGGGSIRHGLPNGTPVAIGATSSLPGGIGGSTVYYVVNRTNTTFKVSATPGVAGTPVNISSNGSGVFVEPIEPGIQFGEAGILISDGGQLVRVTVGTGNESSEVFSGALTVTALGDLLE